MKDNDMNELSMEELENVSGGTREQWHAIDCIFRGGDLFAVEDVGFLERCQTIFYIKQRTGFQLRYGEVNANGEKELIYEAPDGTIYSHDDFMDYLKDNYTLSYLSGGIYTDD